MATKYAPRVKETTATTGTGTYTLAGAVTGFQTFLSGIGNGYTTQYCCTDGTNWEIGVGTLSGGTSLARTSVVASTNSNSAVNWSAGTKDIFIIFPYQMLHAIQGGPYGAFTGTAIANDVEGTDNIAIGNDIQIAGSSSNDCIGIGYNHYIGSDKDYAYAIGNYAGIYKDNVIAFSTGGKAYQGDMQQTLYNRYVQTTNATEAGITDTGLVPVNSYNATIAYVVDVVARQTAGSSGTVGDSKWVRLEFLVRYATSPSMTLIGSVTTTTVAASAGASAWVAEVDVGETNCIRVAGEADKTILWLASIKGIELGIPF